MTKRAALEKRLSSYWKMEVANAAILPSVMVFVAASYNSPVGWLSLVAFLPMIGLLLIGGVYWRAKRLILTGDPAPMQRSLAVAHHAQIPACLGTVIVLILAALSWVMPEVSKGLGDRIVATVSAVLAALEYINYYHRQIQHFDHAEDFERLMAGRGFRRSQMHVDLRKWRLRKTQSR